MYLEASMCMFKENIAYITKIFNEAGISPIDYVTKVPSNYFYNNKDIKDINIGSKFTRIGAGAFENSSVESIVIGENVKFIETEAFMRCNNLKRVIIKSPETCLYENCFESCESLEDFNIAGPKVTIKQGAFAGDYDLLNITFGGTMHDWLYNDIDIGLCDHNNISKIICSDGEKIYARN